MTAEASADWLRRPDIAREYIEILSVSILAINGNGSRASAQYFY